MFFNKAQYKMDRILKLNFAKYKNKLIQLITAAELKL